VVGAGPGAVGGHVKVFDGTTGAEVRSFFAFDGFAGGVFVSAGDANGDGRDDLLVVAGQGGNGHVKVFDGRGSADPTPKPLPGPEDGPATLAFLVRAAGDDAGLLLMRGDLHGRYGEWRAAAADDSRLVRRLPASADLWVNYAPLLLQAGDQDAYRSLCRQMLDKYGATRDPMVAERVAKACLLAKGDGLGRVQELLETTQRTNVPEWFRPFAELARGMAEYRGGDHAAAVDWLVRCRPRGRPGELSDECDAVRGFFLAMAHHGLGQHEEAAKAFEQARAVLGRVVAAQATRATISWVGVLHATIAEAEAKGLLKVQPR